MNVMTHAWHIARTLSAEFGGNAKDILPGCLRLAHAAAKAAKERPVALKTNGVNTIVILYGVKVCTLKASTLAEVMCKIVSLGKALASSRPDVVEKLRTVWKILNSHANLSILL